MKLAKAAILLLAFGVLYIAAADDSAKAPAKHKVAADFKTCPDGHRALKDVPILWGLVGLHVKKTENYNDEDRKLAERVSKGEVVLGGDLIIGNPPPTTKVICQKCGFEFNPADLPEDSPRWDFWEKSGKKPSDFKIPFSKTLLGFPLSGLVEGSLAYSQSLDAKGKLLQWESVSFHSILKPNTVLKAVQKWMLENQRDPADLKCRRKVYAYDNYSYRDNYVSLNIQEDTYWNPGQVSIYLSLRPQEARKQKQVFDDNMISAPAPPAAGDPFAPAPASKETSSHAPAGTP